MGKFLKELFEQYAKRLLTNKVRPSISEEGIMTIPNNKRVKLMAENLYKDFKKAGVPDDILKTENDIKVFHHKIAEINNENIVNQFDTLMSESTLFNPKKSADILPFKFKKSFGEEVDSMIKKGEVNVGTADKTPPYKPSKSQTDFEIQEQYRTDNEKAIKRFEEKMKKDKPDDMATGGRAGYYGGGITSTLVGEDLSDIGHGSDSLMARNMQIAPGGQATTSTGLNYLLGQDNDTVRVPYSEGKNFKEYLKEKEINDRKMYEEQLMREYKENIRRKKVMDSKQMAAEGGRIGYKDGEMVLPQPKPNADPMVELLRVYNIYQESMPGVSQETQKYLKEDFIQKLNDAGISQEAFMTNRMQNNFADGGRIGYNKGKAVKPIIDEGRRGFMKAAGATTAGIAALKTGLLGFGEKVAPVAKEAVETATGAAQSVPPYFWKLVDKIKSLGDDAPRLAVKDREKVTTYKEYELTEDITTGDLTIQRMKVTDPESASYYGQPLTEETYMSYKPSQKILLDEANPGGGVQKTFEEYEEGTALLRNDGMNAGEVVEESAGISDEIFEEIGEAVPEAIRKTKADGGRIGYNKGKAVKELIKAGEGKFTKAQYLIERIKNTIKGSPDDKYVQETFPGFIKELEANPDLAKNENVFKELGGDLPEGQQIVVYGDDTLDFFTTSSGPQNIKKLEEFMAKHGLPRDKALKFMKMEPNDQVMELTKTKFLKNKQTDN